MFLIADDPPMTAPAPRPLRPVGRRPRPSSTTCSPRRRRSRRRDDRVDIVDKKTDDHGMLAITSIYVGYLLPMMVEIQYWEFRVSEPALRRVRPPRLEARVHRLGARPTRGGRSVELAQLAERVGYDHLWVYDHVETVPRREATHCFEAFTMLAALSPGDRAGRARPAGHVRELPQRRAAREGGGVHRRVLRRPAHPRHRRGLVRAGSTRPTATSTCRDRERLAVLEETITVIPRLWSEETVDVRRASTSTSTARSATRSRCGRRARRSGSAAAARR